MVDFGYPLFFVPLRIFVAKIWIALFISDLLKFQWVNDKIYK
jgi:hypothetical protein